MVDCYDDYESSIKLIIEEYKTLQVLNPQHKLLRLIEKVSDEGFYITELFYKEYHHMEEGHKTVVGKANSMNGAYYQDLEKAVKLELRKLLSQERGKTETEIWKKMEEGGLVGVVRTHLTHNRCPLTDFVN